MPSYISRFTLWHALLALVTATPTSSNLGLKKFTSLVVFGDSWTDSGLRDYAPDENGNIGQPVCQLPRRLEPGQI
jgi:phospholipase/lecithinase/hemolysin